MKPFSEGEPGSLGLSKSKINLRHRCTVSDDVFFFFGKFHRDRSPQLLVIPNGDGGGIPPK